MSNEKATESSGFLDGRYYTATFLYELIALLVGNGVYANELAPTATNENMTITHGSGHAWINGVCYKNTTPFILKVGTADGRLNRYDSLMVRLDLSKNETYAIIVQGEFATNPTPPAVTRNAETWDLKICDIYIPAGCTKITQDLITDTRLDSSVCGVPVFPVEHLDMTTFYRQISNDLAKFRETEQRDFARWTDEQKQAIRTVLEDLKQLVDVDTVGELRNRLAEVANKLEKLTAEDVGALPKTGGTMNGNIDMGSNKITSLSNPTAGTDAANKEYVDNSRKAVNLLDNSDFREPVNQRGETTYTCSDAIYTIDRWKSATKANPYTVALKSGSVTLTSQATSTAIWMQALESLPGDVYTLAVKTTAGLYCKTYRLSEAPDGAPLHLDHNWWANINTDGTYPKVRLVHTADTVGDAVSIVWVALYEGSYTAETLPPYVPKGYGAELTECRRYYRERQWLLCVKTSGNFFAVAETIEMRAVPTAAFKQFSPFGKDNITDFTGRTISAVSLEKGLVHIMNVSLPTCAEHSAGGLLVTLSADL